MSYITDNAIINEVLDCLLSYNLTICQVCEKKIGEINASVTCNEHFLFCEEAIEEALKRRKADYDAKIEKYNNDIKYQKEAKKEAKVDEDGI